jgi:hypothetical protein
MTDLTYPVRARRHVETVRPRRATVWLRSPREGRSEQVGCGSRLGAADGTHAGVADMIVLIVLAPLAAMLLLMGMASIERWQEKVPDTRREDVAVARGERQMSPDHVERVGSAGSPHG